MQRFFIAITGAVSDQEESERSIQRTKEGDREGRERGSVEPLYYETLILDGLRYLTDSVEELEQMTLRTYRLKLKVYQLRKLDEMKEAIELEFMKRALKATKQKGDKVVYVVNKVEDIFDYEKEEKKLLGDNSDSDKFKDLRKIAHRLKNLRKEVN